MIFERFRPVAALRPFIRELLLIESETAVCSTILPETSVVLAFRYKGLVAAQQNGHIDQLPETVVSGLRKTVRKMQYSSGTANLLVIFREGGLAAFSRVPAYGLFDQSVDAATLFPAQILRDITERLVLARTGRERVSLIEQFLLDRFSGHKTDLLITHAIGMIRQQNGHTRIKNLAAELYISRDPFEKRFRAITGTSPKQFASIIRLRNLVQQLPATGSLTEMAYEAGYFDQSHFIRDFRLFTGQSPKEFLHAGPFW